MILSDRDIQEKRFDHDNKIVIEPFELNCLQPASYDLHLGNDYIVYRNNMRGHSLDTIKGDDSVTSAKGTISNWESQGGFRLNPGDFLLAETQEHIELPNDIAARLEGKSSLGRLGTLVHATAGFIDPGFKGKLTLEIFTVMPVGIVLHEGQKISQISFIQLTSPCSVPYGSGDKHRYQNATGVERSKGVGE